MAFKSSALFLTPTLTLQIRFSETHFLRKTHCVGDEIYSVLSLSMRETSAMYCSMRAALSRCMRSDTWP